MRQTWRWFGPKDLVSIDAMRQAGVEGVVSALHHVPTGVVWTPDDIAERQRQIGTMQDGSSSGLTWDVVESLPVSEDIKKQKGDWRDHIANWKTSMHHLRDAGVEVICYNFMPVLDWTRTDLSWRRPTGATCMRFDFTDFAAFDIHILERPGAAEDFPEAIVDAAARRFAEMSGDERAQLAGNVVFGLPGAAENFTLEDVRRHLAEYDNIREETLRGHLVDFLSEVTPLAEELGLRLCCHPDDPPFPLLGLPRIMSTEADYAAIMQAVDLPANGITLCTGSLGARADNDAPGMMRRMGERVHFLHLRNVTLDTPEEPRGSFFEDEHLAGQTDMVEMISAVLDEERRRKAAGRADWQIPMRPDHGQDILDDLGRKAQPGYPAIGRLKGLAELRGIMTALNHPRGMAGA
ncbi:mannonate dehydratase [Falsirhodobacter algicola]|uniref:Mannonate dehydratase n=1 Tax=Falsirhodobacter algicola TaxID=2692330 RepID=A0A8J8MT37_9RHOB|nr:mannonate dehydratase [Falsirhodobacter algicola]QUS36226.1 mannonate dehydratase [Falsirhodobacter algicola]